MRDFQEFIDKKIAVESTDEFMQLCEDEGLLWNSGKKPTEQKIHPYVTFRANGDDAISSSCIDHFKRKGYEIVPASEFLTPSSPTIEIFQSKQTVVCLKKQDNKVVAVGKAKCNPDDQFNFDYGAKLAYERMEMDIVHRTIKMAGESLAQGLSDGMNGIKTLKNGMRIKKQDRYEVGDRVLIKKKWKSPIVVNQMDFMLGNVYEIVKTLGELNATNGNQYRMKVCDGDIKNFDYYWSVCDSDIKGKVIQ